MSWTIDGPWIEGDKDTEWKWKIEKEALHIAFKGSTSRLDWLQNFRFWVRPYKKMPVTWYAHSGLVSKWKAIEDDVLKLVTSKNLPVKLSGFSQGGGVAILANESIRYHCPNLMTLTMTYGAPRVVWFWNLGKIKHRFLGVMNWQNRQDIVPHLPPWLFGYRHVNKIKRIGKWRPTLRFKKAHMSYWS